MEMSLNQKERGRAMKRQVLGLPRYTLGEEIFSSVSHGVSALFAVAAMVLLLRIPIKVLGGKVGVRKLPGFLCLRPHLRPYGQRGCQHSRQLRGGAWRAGHDEAGRYHHGKQKRSRSHYGGRWRKGAEIRRIPAAGNGGLRCGRHRRLP